MSPFRTPAHRRAAACLTSEEVGQFSGPTCWLWGLRRTRLAEQSALVSRNRPEARTTIAPIPAPTIRRLALWVAAAVVALLPAALPADAAVGVDVVSGTVAATVGVQVDSAGRVVATGTERYVIRRERRGDTVIVTVSPIG